MTSFRCCQVVASINRDTGGPAVSVPRLAEALAQSGVACGLVTLDYDRHGPQMPVRGVRVTSLPANFVARNFRGFSPMMRRRISNLAMEGVEIIHNHGLWMFPNLYARQAAVRHGVPLVISPRGMLSDWALHRGWLKKAVVWHAFERRNLSAASLFHATAADEAATLRALGFRQPIAVIPNGVDVEDLRHLPPRSQLETRFPELRGRRWLLFLSRLHPKKGLDELIAAWRALQDKFPDWHLVLAGPDLNGYRRTLDRLIAAAGVARRVTVTGMLADDDKRAAFGHAGLFVLPTHSENFGVAVAEALAFKVPVVTTKAAPWAELESERCGWWIDDSTEALVAALGSALRMREEDLEAMGRRGQSLMERKYSWRRVGEQMLSAYQWCCSRGERPHCVQQD